MVLASVILQILFQTVYLPQKSISSVLPTAVVLLYSLTISINLKTETMQTQTITTTSNTRTIINLCIVAFFVSATISMVGKIGIHGIMINILDWQTM
jgi:hypothetical protein